jgi:formylmethanofuran dehydrogenase subunit E
MPFDDRKEDGEEFSNEPKVECSMCHQQARLSQSVVMGGRRLCFGCAAAWFDDDEDESESESED